MFFKKKRLYSKIKKTRSLFPKKYLYLKSLSSNNKYSSVIGPIRGYEAITAALKSAKKSINIEMYIYVNDLIGRLIAEILMKKAQEGVKVNLVLDRYGTNEYGGLGKLEGKLEKAGVNVVYAIPFFSSLRFYWRELLERIMFGKNIIGAERGFDNRDHRKLIIIDGKVCFIGGINVGNEFLWSKDFSNNINAWQDVQVKIEGDACSFCQLKFLERLAVEQRGIENFNPGDYFYDHEKTKQEEVKIIVTIPGEEKEIENVYLNKIRQAKRRIYIENSYFLSRRILKELINASRKGVEVIVIIPLKYSDEPLIRYATHPLFYNLSKKGIKVYEYLGRMCHTKAAVIDDIAIVGSANLDNRSFSRDYELNAIFFDKAFVEKFNKALFMKDLKSSKEIEKPKPYFLFRIVSWLLLRLERFL